jgi:4-amino-4-deoxy-L-arabinose transferase-like glycosyltransferase
MDKPYLRRAALILVLAVALALRWRYVREISLFVDEFVTAWAARSIPVLGLPIFPSGNLYPHGLVFSYLEAPFVLGPFNETMARLPALILSLATVPILYWIGRRLFSESVGLIAAAALAVDPECVIWGGRARMYSLLQLLTLLVVYFSYQGLVHDRPRSRYLAMGLLVVAAFTHAEAIFLLPVLGLTAIVVWPWRRLFRASVALPFALGALGALAFFLAASLGQPGHLETLQQNRPYLNFPVNLLNNLQAFAPVLTQVYRLPFTLLAVAGLIPPFRLRADTSEQEWGHSPLTYLYTVLILFLVSFLLLVGATWQNERYLFLLLPLLFLVGSAVLNELVDRVARALGPSLSGLKRAAPWRGAVLALVVALFVGLTGSPTAYSQEPGYDLAFRYLRERWQPERGEQVVTFSPTAAMLYLGRCDFFAIQRGYEEYVIARPGDGRPADLWTATPLLNTTAQFVDLLASAPRVWFVIDDWRFQTRYEPGFILAVLDTMDLEYHQGGVMIFRSEGYTAPAPPAVKHKRQAGFGGELRLTGFDLSPGEELLNPGDSVDVTLHWEAIAPTDVSYVAFLDLIGPDGSSVARVDEAVLRGLYHPSFWSAGESLPDHHRLSLPSDLPPGRYRLDLGLYHPDQADQPLAVKGQGSIALESLSVSRRSP